MEPINMTSIISLNKGVITLFNHIKNELRKYNLSITEDQIESVILNNSPMFLDKEYISLINRMTKEYVETLMKSLNEHGYDFKLNPTLFVGGGSELLKAYIEKIDSIKYFEFQDKFSNCYGYELLAKKQLKKLE